MSISQKQVVLTDEGIEVSRRFMGLDTSVKKYLISKGDGIIIKKVRSRNSSAQISVWLEMIILDESLRKTSVMETMSKDNKAKLEELISAMSARLDMPIERR